ncbi:accessory Sec system protein Asp3 [Fructilactobacillus florum]|uniref:Accessory Sec system protein Asp3 n=1 Tax=Fructilactobacillus florum DSM 22689 = JCM 16035 TaxID=1423745 RepID=A0A0R2CKW5_9LACO|nr:accessory Sec system protein Asp3 [Fructilactobacillus florum]KRM92248.1 hypothetical protein FC87_GL000375 [Fructilactobacillus florum DSM 22689 = JCM 16035]
METTLSFLTWPPQSITTDTYGSTINYNDDNSVSYQNLLQPAGTRIHTWETNHNINRREPLQLPDKRAPFLKNGQRYRLQGYFAVEPQNSVGLSLRTFNAKQELQQDQMVLQDHLDFTLQPSDTDYELALVKFNNYQLRFRVFYLASQTLFATYRLESHWDDYYFDLIRRTTTPVKKQQLAVKRYRSISDVMRIELDPAEVERLRILLVPQKMPMEQVNQLRLAANHQLLQIK